MRHGMEEGDMTVVTRRALFREDVSSGASVIMSETFSFPGAPFFPRGVYRLWVQLVLVDIASYASCQGYFRIRVDPDSKVEIGDKCLV